MMLVGNWGCFSWINGCLATVIYHIVRLAINPALARGQHYQLDNYVLTSVEARRNVKKIYNKTSGAMITASGLALPVQQTVPYPGLFMMVDC